MLMLVLLTKCTARQRAGSRARTGRRLLLLLLLGEVAVTFRPRTISCCAGCGLLAELNCFAPDAHTAEPLSGGEPPSPPSVLSADASGRKPAAAPAAIALSAALFSRSGTLASSIPPSIASPATTMDPTPLSRRNTDRPALERSRSFSELQLGLRTWRRLPTITAFKRVDDETVKVESLEHALYSDAEKRRCVPRSRSLLPLAASY